MTYMKYPPRWPLLLATMLVMASVAVARWYLRASAPHVTSSEVLILGVSDIAICLIAGGSLIAVSISTMMIDYQRRLVAARLAASLSELRQRAERESEQKRFVMLGTLAAGLAHELGQPLSSARVDIDGLDLIRKIGRTPSLDHIELVLKRIGRNVTAMSQTIEQLRALAAPRSSPVQPVELTSLIDTLLADREHWLPDCDVRIHWQRPPTGVTALGDAAGIRLIITNLVRNACDAVSGMPDERREVRVEVGPGPTVAIRDRGRGISDEHLKRLFDPFFTTKTAGSHGIGLSLTRASAERMNAEVSVDSHIDQGSVFILRLMDHR